MVKIHRWRPILLISRTTILAHTVTTPIWTCHKSDNMTCIRPTLAVRRARSITSSIAFLAVSGFVWFHTFFFACRTLVVSLIRHSHTCASRFTIVMPSAHIRVIPSVHNCCCRTCVGYLFALCVTYLHISSIKYILFVFWPCSMHFFIPISRLDIVL